MTNVATITTKQDLSENPNFTKERVKFVYEVLDYYVNIVAKRVYFLFGSREDFINDVMLNLVSRKGYKENHFTEVNYTNKKDKFNSPLANYIRQVAYNHLKNGMRDYENQIKYLRDDSDQWQVLSLDSSYVNGDAACDLASNVMDHLEFSTSHYQEQLDFIQSEIENETNPEHRYLMKKYVKALGSEDLNPKTISTMFKDDMTASKTLSEIKTKLSNIVKNMGCFITESEDFKLKQNRRYIINKTKNALTFSYNGEVMEVAGEGAMFAEDLNLIESLSEGLVIRKKVKINDVPTYAVFGNKL